MIEVRFIESSILINNKNRKDVSLYWNLKILNNFIDLNF